jgi:hypothetical protein
MRQGYLPLFTLEAATPAPNPDAVADTRGAPGAILLVGESALACRRGAMGGSNGL